jgi:hypothetical protein
MTLNFEQLLKLTFLKSEYPLNPVLVAVLDSLDPVNPVPTKTGFSEYSHCYIIILHTVKSTAEQKGDGRREKNHEAEAYDDNMTLNSY